MFLSRCISRERSEDTLQRLLEKVNRVPLHEDFHFRVTNGQRAEVKRVLHCEGISLLSASASPPRICMSSKRITPTNTNFTHNSHYTLQRISQSHQVFLHTAGKHFSFRVHQRAGIYSRSGVPWQPRNPWKWCETEFPPDSIPCHPVNK